MLDGLGPSGSWKIILRRVEPTEMIDPASGKRVKTEGFLRDYYEPLDEQLIAQRHGGGRYMLQIKKKNAGGTFVYHAQRTIDVAGDPRCDDVPRAVVIQQHATGQANATADAAPGIVKDVLNVMKDQLHEANARANAPRGPEAPRGIDPAVQAVLDMMKTQVVEANRQVEAMRKELVDLRNVKPAEDPFKEKMLDRFMVDDSSRLQSVRLQYESEIRQLKEGHAQEERRLRDRFEDEKRDVKQSYEREIVMLKQTHDIQLQAAKGAYETNMKLAEAENRRLERDNNELRIEVKDLRAKKEKSFIETLKEAETIKELVGAGGDDDDKSTIGQIIEAVPGAIEVAKGLIQKPQPPQQQAAAQGAASNGQAVVPSRKVVQTPDGQRFMLEANGSLRPIKKKKEKPTAPGMPDMDPAMVTTVIGYLERAFSGNQDAEIFAQSAKTMVPVEVMTVIRDHGVDEFMAKVAKLPSTSPLSSQAGKNWLRAVGKALVGE